MSYRIAGMTYIIKMLAVVLTDVEVEGEYEFERRQFGTPLTICDGYRNGSSNRGSRKL